MTPERHLDSIARRGVELLHLAALAMLAALLLRNHFAIVTAPVPLDFYEGTMPLITGLVARGINPYTFPWQPAFADVYPPLYNLVVAPLTLVFGNGFLVHRLVGAIFILGCCVLLAVAARRTGASRSDSAAAALLLYGALLFYSTPVASTNALGEFLFLASVLVPWLTRFDRGGLAASIACGLLAFYTKQYFVMGVGLVAAYLFIAVSRRKATIYGVCAAATLVASLVAVHLTSPYFLDNTVFAVRNLIGALHSTEALLQQLRFFAATYPGLLLLAASSGVAALLRWRRGGGTLAGALAGAMRPGTDLHAPPRAYPWFCLAGATAAIVAVLGLNPGNFMTYLFQLMSPFLLLGICGIGALRGPRRLLLLPLVWYSLFQAWSILPKDFRIDPVPWERTRELVAGSERILASPILVMTLIEQDKTVYQAGHTFYFRLAENKPAFLEPAQPERRVAAIWRAYLEQLYADVRERKFDLVLLTPWDVQGIFQANPPPGMDVKGVEYFKRYYHITETFPISLTERPGGGTFQMQVWRPRAEPEQATP